MRFYSKPWLCPAGCQGQHAVLAIERLDRCLIVHAEHGGVRRRVQVQANHVGGLALEVRVVGDEVPLQPVWLQSVLAPDALDGRERHVAQFGCELATAPVRGAVAGLVLDRRSSIPTDYTVQANEKHPSDRHCMMNPIRAALFFACMSCASSYAVVIDGVNFEDDRLIKNQSLVLNGVGKRVVLFFDAYYAALYLPNPSSSFTEIADRTGPRQLDIRLLRDVQLSSLESLLVDGVTKNSSSADLATITPTLNELLETMRRIKTFKKGDVLQLTFTGSATQVVVNGAAIGPPIGGLAFNNALLSIWLGKRPIDQRLKDQLLGARQPGPRQ